MEAVGAVRLKGQKSVKFFLTASSAFADIGAPMKKKASFIQTGLSQPTASIDQRESRDGRTRRPMSKFRPLLLALFLGVCFASYCEATVYYSDGSAANVQALTNIATDGDTITIPAGWFTWNTTVTVSGKAVTLQGA